jgi:DNA-binding Lrp family transcriptional regulator
MRKVYVLIKCELGRAYEVAEKLGWLERGPEVDSISGEHDLIARLYLEDGEDIGRVIASEVHSVPGIKDTQTLICFRAFSKDRGPQTD